MVKLRSEFQRLKTVIEAKKVLGHLKDAQTELKRILKSKTRSQEIRKYADFFGKEVRKQINAVVAKLRKLAKPKRASHATKGKSGSDKE